MKIKFLILLFIVFFTTVNVICFLGCDDNVGSNQQSSQTQQTSSCSNFESGDYSDHDSSENGDNTSSENENNEEDSEIYGETLPY